MDLFVWIFQSNHLNGAKLMFSELFRKIIIPDKKRLFEIPRVRLIDNSSNICPNDPE